jgi:predicted AlkP superfamily pyrophosphatase or phosphodiesterase
MFKPTASVLTLAVCLGSLLLQPVRAGSSLPTEGPQRASAPPLVVLLVVDQFRSDYLVDYAPNFMAGLRRLSREGAWFKQGAYPYLNTVTCAGHSTIGTGSFPYRHGMILNGWFDRETGRVPFCTEDPGVSAISYNNLPAGQGNSAKQMLEPTLAEQIHARGGRSVGLSLKPRAAIPLAGKHADAVIWFDDRGGWSTSSAYTNTPVPFLQEFISANPLTADYDKVWDRTLPLSAYRHGDDEAGEGSASGWTRTFPHPLGTSDGKPDGAFYSRWQRSPFADEYLGRMAIAAVDALGLGRGDSTDFLGISFSSLDSVGHTFGPKSHEVQDLLVRLDRTIGRLLDHLDKTVGPGNYILGFSSDHGVAEIPEQVRGGGRQPGKVAMDALNKSLGPLLGPGQHVAAANYTDIYLASKVKAKLKQDPRIANVTMETLRSLPGVDRVFRGDELADSGARSSKDRVRRAASLSYHPDRSGDFIIVPKEKWLLSTSVTTHGTHYLYDQQVPVIVFGASVKAGEYRGAATPADLAPTLAAVAGVRIAQTDGRVLKEALQPR